MKISVSRSVARAFAVMEVFRETRRPANATDLSRRLNAPHSSVVAVLYNLRDLGYLWLDDATMTFFPTMKLQDLAGWLRPDPQAQDDLGSLVDDVARDTGHLTVLSSRLSLFVNTVAVRAGRFPAASGPAKAVGAALTASVPGLVILAQMEDDEVRGIVRDTEAWLRDAGAAKSVDAAATLDRVRAVRAQGFLVGSHPTCRGTEILAYPLAAAPASTPCALAMHVPVLLSRGSKAQLRQRVERHVRDHRAGGSPVPIPAAPLPARWPAGRLQAFRTGFAPPGLMPASRMQSPSFDGG